MQDPKAVHIPLISPTEFEEQRWFVSYDRPMAPLVPYDNFYIHRLGDDSYHLKIPIPLHRQTVSDCLVITEGQCGRQIGPVLVDLKAPCLLVMPAGWIVGTPYLSDDIKGYYCHFSAAWVRHPMGLFHPSTFPTVQALDASTVEIFVPLLERLVALYQQNRSAKLLHRYLYLLLEEAALLAQQTAPPSNAAQDLALRYCQLLQQKPSAHWRIRDLAQALHCSPNHLNKCVQRTFGQSASQLQAAVLLVEAKVLLQQPNTSIQAVSDQLGFSDPSYFGRFFKKHTQQAPSVYQKGIELSG